MGDITARFNDGKTAASRDVRVDIKPKGLELRDSDGLLVAFWRKEDLQADRPPSGKGLRVRCTADPDARLHLEDPAPLAHLLPRPENPAFPWRVIAVCAVTSIALIFAAWRGIPMASNAIVRFVPLELEQKWGEPLAVNLAKQWGRCQSPAGEAALLLLSDRITTALPPVQRPRRVWVVKSSMENAIALPGGTVILFDALLQNAETPDTIAGVLAHEFTHIALRHNTAAMIRAAGLGALVTIITGDASGILATGGTMALAGSYSREDETEADRGAVALLQKAGIDTQGMADFFRHLEKTHGSPPPWISTHPDSGERARMVETLAAGRHGMAALSPDQWDALKGICR